MSTSLNNDNAFILDFQGFKTLSNKFVLKEIAICGIRKNVILHFFVKPPRANKKTLHPEQQRRNKYLIDNVHGIPWDRGYVDFQDVINLFNDTFESPSPLSQPTTIYVKGSERRKYIEDLIADKSVQVIDLDLLDCPKVQNISQPDYPERFGSPFLECCFQKHSYRTIFPVQPLRCALKNAQLYRTWILSKCL